MLRTRSICFANSHIQWGGGEKWHYEAALAFLQKGWNVSAICHPAGELYKRLEQQSGISTLPLPLSNHSFLNPFIYQEIKKFLQTEHVDSVIMNLPADLKAVATPAFAAKIPHILYRRGSALPVKNGWLNRKLFGLLSGVIANSQETKKLLMTDPPLIAPNKMHLLPNGIDIASFDASIANALSLKRTFPGLIIGTAGRLNKQKAQHILLYLAADFKKKHYPFSLLIAGAGEREKELKTLSKKLGVADCTHFLGFQESLAWFWNTIDVFILPSLWEGFGFVLAEAMLAQKPVLAFNVSNMPELISNGKNGFLFPLPPYADVPTHKPDLTEMLSALNFLHMNKELRNHMGRQGRSFATTHFCQSQRMNDLENILQLTEKYS